MAIPTTSYNDSGSIHEVDIEKHNADHLDGDDGLRGLGEERVTLTEEDVSFALLARMCLLPPTQSSTHFADRRTNVFSEKPISVSSPSSPLFTSSKSSTRSYSD